MKDNNGYPQKTVTIKHIAELAGMSFSTVAKALRDDPVVNENTKQKILQIASETNYYPNLLAKGLKNRKTKTIGIILNDLQSPFYSDIYKVIGDTLNTRDYTMLLCDSSYDVQLERKNIITMLSKGVEGIIISPVNDSSENMELLVESNLKAVFIDSYPSFRNINYVYMDHEKAGFLAAEHLIKNGHERILLINGPEVLSSSHHFLSGYKRAHKLYNIPLINDLVLFTHISIESGFKLMEGIFHNKYGIDNYAFTAIMSLSDLLAIGIYEAAKELNFCIPEDYSVIGYDNIFATKYISPPLTTIHQPKTRTGKFSVTILLDQITGDSKEYQRIIIDPRLIIRNSVKKRLH
jgi:LacI family transcriptional regulator